LIANNYVSQLIFKIFTTFKSWFYFIYKL